MDKSARPRTNVLQTQCLAIVREKASVFLNCRSAAASVRGSARVHETRPNESVFGTCPMISVRAARTVRGQEKVIAENMTEKGERNRY